MNLIRAKWQHYLNYVLLPRLAPAIQIRECEKTFYAGANAMYDLIMEADDWDPDDPDPDATERVVETLQSVQEEIGDYINSLIRETQSEPG